MELVKVNLMERLCIWEVANQIKVNRLLLDGMEITLVLNIKQLLKHNLRLT